MTEAIRLTDPSLPQRDVAIPQVVAERMLSFPEDIISQALADATPNAAGIKLPQLIEDEPVEGLPYTVGYYVGAIPVGGSVLDHVHSKNPEFYLVLKGKGSMLTGAVVNEGTAVRHNQPFDVDANPASRQLVIGEKVTHSLRNTGSEELIFIFAGEKSHIVNAGDEIDGIKGDRVFVNELPEAA